MAIRGDIVDYVSRAPATRADRRGMGNLALPDNPAIYGRIASIVQRVLPPGDRLALVVLSSPPFDAICIPFNPALPRWGTWTPIQ